MVYPASRQNKSNPALSLTTSEQVLTCRWCYLAYSGLPMRPARKWCHLCLILIRVLFTDLVYKHTQGGSVAEWLERRI